MPSGHLSVFDPGSSRVLYSTRLASDALLRSRPGGGHVCTALFGEAFLEAAEGRVLHDLSGEQTLALGEVRRLIQEGRRCLREYLRDAPEIRGRVHLHEYEIFALGEDVGVDLARTLGSHQQVNTELATLPGSLDRMAGDSSFEVVRRLLRADVVSFIDHQQDGLTLMTVPPEVA